MKASIIALSCIVIGLATRPAAADGETRYTVEAGDTCSSIAQRFYGDARLVEPIHEANGMRSPPPHALVAGTVLVIPPRPGALAPGPDAKLSSVKNLVEVLAPAPRQGHVDDPLFRGNRIATEAVSAAAITFRDETQVRLGEKSLIVLLGDAKAAAATPGASVAATLVTGNLRAFLAKSDARANIATDSAAVRVVEGEARVSADPAKTTRLAVYQGNSTISAKQVRREVPSGFGSKADLGRAPTVPRPLPPTPTWAAPTATVQVDTGAGTPPAAASYALPHGATAGVSAWHVQIARDASFLDLVVDETVPNDTTRVEVKGGVPGRYFARVSAIDDDHFEGPFARPLALGLVQVRRAAAAGAADSTVSVMAPDIDCWRVGNVALARVTSSFAVHRGEPVLLRCATSADDPSTLVRVD